MAPRVAHLLLIAGLSLTIYAYASYYTNPGPPIKLHLQEVLPSLPFTVDKNATSFPEQDWSKQTVNTSVPSVQSVSSVVVSSSSVTPSPTASQNITAKTPRDLSKGVKTRYLYEAGHSVPRPEICPNLGAHLRLLIVIMSAPSHFDARMAIRLTWGHFNIRKDVSIAFLLGQTDSVEMESRLDAEGTLYSDIIRGRFFDSYNNLTLKTVSMMEWVGDYCPKAKFLLKTDDDMFINVPRLLAFTEKHINDTKLIFGRLAKKWKPIRNPKSKYYVSKEQYKLAVFPDFTTGPAYLMPASMASDMYSDALNQTYLKLEDVFMTGIVAQKLKIKRLHVAEFLNKRIAMNVCTIQRAISIHMVKFGEQFDLWKKLLDGKTRCK